MDQKSNQAKQLSLREPSNSNSTNKKEDDRVSLASCTPRRKSFDDTEPPLKDWKTTVSEVEKEWELVKRPEHLQPAMTTKWVYDWGVYEAQSNLDS